ncbi:MULTISPECIES: hypothetical protein [unclassified Novosphingobium]|uniref:hypothetical protein n=1 Tax=unclassified Novosphingobium TaxID=2644732 RepID=UPI0013C32626|nr:MULTISPECIES: hypothetical protein [unclassified Novosphingobium]NLR39738.1 hypothetical protein [Novosphingobium sp. ERW19]
MKGLFLVLMISIPPKGAGMAVSPLVTARFDITGASAGFMRCAACLIKLAVLSGGLAQQTRA